MIYIVRHILLSDDYGSVRIDSESAFSTWDGAQECMKSIVEEWEEDRDPKDLIAFRIEIVELPLGHIDPWDKKREWLYSLDGRLVESYPNPECEKPDFERFEYEGKFKPGDIVAIKPSLHEPNSSSIRGDFGIVIQTPIDKAEWIKASHEPSDWDGHYIVYYITDTGIMHHKHLPECALENLSQALPDELLFLKMYSDHLNNVKPLPNELFEKVSIDRIFVRNMKTFSPEGLRSDPITSTSTKS